MTKSYVSLSDFFCGTCFKIVLVALLFLLSVNVFAYQDGLVAYYNFDNDSNVVTLCADVTGNGHNLVVHKGDPTASSFGALNGCAVFDGDPDNDSNGSSIYQVNKNHPQLYPAGDFTVSVWVKANVTPSTTQTKWVTRNKNKCGFGIYTNTTGVWAAGVSNGVNNVVSGEQRINGTAIVVGKWTHIVLTFKANGVPSGGVYTGTETLYINGTEISSKEVGYRPRSNDDSENDDRFGIGYDGLSTSTGFFNGNIDEFTVFNFVLAPQDIVSLATKKKNPPQIRRIIAYYGFDDAMDFSDNIITDDSGNEHILHKHYTMPAANANGAVNGAADFNGVSDSLYQLNRNHTELYPAGDFTVVTWVRADVIPADSNAIYVTRNKNLCGYAICENPAGIWTVILQDGLHSWTTGAVKLNSPYNIVVGQWTHITLTFAASGPADVNGIYTGTAIMYVNGERVVTKTIGYRPRSNSDPENNDRFGVGYDGVPSSYFNGGIDEFAIFAGVLQPYEISALARKTVSPLDVLYAEPEVLVAHYSFDDALDLGKDDSGSGLNLNAKYGTPTATTGIINGAANFDGDDGLYFSLYGRPEIFPPGDFSVSVWAKANAEPSGLSWISKARRSSCGFGIFTTSSIFLSTYNQWAIGVADGTDTPDDSGQYASLLSLISGQWVHLACTFKASGMPNEQGVYSGTLTAYINGLPFNGRITTYKPTSTSSDDRFAIGFQGSTGGFFNGAIDEFAVFRTALSSTQINLLSQGYSIDEVLNLSEPVIGDINGDTKVNIIDFSILAAEWLETVIK